MKLCPVTPATSRNFPLHFICQNWVSWPQLHQQLAERSNGCHWFLPWCCMSGVTRRKWGFCEWREGAMAGYVTSSICHTENRGPFGSLRHRIHNVSCVIVKKDVGRWWEENNNKCLWDPLCLILNCGPLVVSLELAIGHCCYIILAYWLECIWFEPWFNKQPDFKK